MQSVPITINIVSRNTAHVYSIQQYVIKLLSDMQQVEGFLRVFRFPPPIKLTAKILLKVAINTITHPTSDLFVIVFSVFLVFAEFVSFCIISFK